MAGQSQTTSPVPHRPRVSLRTRMTLWILAISLVIQLTVGVVVLLYQRAAVVSYFDTRLQRTAASVVAALGDLGRPVTDEQLRLLAEERLPSLPFQQFMVVIYAPDGSVSAATARPTPDAADVRRWADAEGKIVPVPIRTLDTGGEHTPARATVLRLSDTSRQEHLILVAAPGQLPAAMTWLAGRALMVVVPVGAIASGLAGWLIAGLALRPLRELGAAAGALTPEAIDAPVALRTVTSETAEVQRQLEDARTRLRTALHAQDRFISNVSHELKTPVAVLLTEAQTLDQSGLSEDQRTFVTSVIDEMRRLGRMVESFLTLTHLRAGKAVTNVRRCSLNDLVMESVTACASMARQFSVRVEPHLEENAEPGVDGNTELLRIMIDNLVRNAIRFAPAQSSVQVIVGHDREACTVLVRDLGPGIPPEVVDRLFDRYSEPGSASPRGRGYGLGLSIAQGIAELHGGKIAARNEPGGGCAFEVRLPAGGPEAAGAPEAASTVGAP